MQFFMPMRNPPRTTHQMKQVRVVNGKPSFYEPPAVQNVRAMLAAHLAKHRPDSPAQGPVRLVVKWCWRSAGKRHRDGSYKTTRPDTDNLQKMLKDVMTELGFWQDDAQVASEICEKFWADMPGIFVSVEEIT